MDRWITTCKGNKQKEGWITEGRINRFLTFHTDTMIMMLHLNKKLYSVIKWNNYTVYLLHYYLLSLLRLLSIFLFWSRQEAFLCHIPGIQQKKFQVNFIFCLSWHCWHLTYISKHLSLNSTVIIMKKFKSFHPPWHALLSSHEYALLKDLMTFFFSRFKRS